MHYNALKQLDRIEKSNLLTNRIIVKALQSDRGDVIRAMNVAGLKKMVVSVFHAVHNILAEEARRASDYKIPYVIEEGRVIVDHTARFKLIPDVEIEEEVTAYFEIDGKLQYRKVEFESFIVLPGIDKSIKWLTKRMKRGVRGMRYNPYSVSDRLEKADILTDNSIVFALQCRQGDFIREMSHADLKLWRKDLCAGFYHELYAEAADNFEKACEDYVPERDGIENDPRKNFKPKTEFEINQEIEAYFEEQGMLHQSR
jgi:hypothetical protein